MNPVLLITGASRGIGAATAILAAQQGWAVAVNYASNAQAANHVVKRIQDEGGKAFAVQADVGDEAQIMRMFAEVDDKLGRISGLVNSAGVVDMTAKVDAQSWERWERMMRINILGSLACAREAVRRMSTLHGGTGGSIVNLSSAATRLGGAGQYVDYATAKGAIDAFTIGLAKEVAAEGIRVNAVNPGLTLTDRLHEGFAADARLKGLSPDEVMAQSVAKIPLGRMAEPEEIANAVLFLASSKASYVTGICMSMDGALNPIVV